jgi:hypothetical protein
MIVASVLRTGGEYSPCHVYNLRDMCRDFLPTHQFICLTDTELSNIDTVRLQRDWLGWWSKLELFKLKGPCLYFDLDTVLVNDCSSLVDALKGKWFATLYDPNTDPVNYELGSGIMYWEDDMQFLYSDFNYAQDCMAGGDQAYIRKRLEEKGLLKNVSLIQQLTTGVVSFKVNNVTSVDPSHKIIYFHGRPRPWEQNKIPYPNLKTRSKHETARCF